ncbi:MAG: hypothetical protein E6K59_09635 [Nitrospirae bacterium]|nr:MAG: hypothetical protein E6K59_09635 [Nitrospirota bacterium]
MTKMRSAISKGTGYFSESCLSPCFLATLLSLPLILLLAAHASALQQMEPKEFAQGVEYTLLMSRDDKVCTHMLALFNSDLKQFGYEKYDAHEEFKSIGWRREKYVRMEGERKVEGSAEVANIDINNDGTKDLLFRRTTSMRGYDRHVLHIFPNIATIEKEWTLDEIVRSPGRISHGGYSLEQPPTKGTGKSKQASIPPLAGVSLLEPFTLHGTTYINMRPLYELSAGSDPASEFSRINVITKYRQGKYGGGPEPNEPETGERDDICYYKVRTKKFVPE